jgi:pimeloyl-ACP methyl ester carboxylesterase
MTRNLLALIFAVTIAAQSIASAEDQPTVFVHGLASSSHTWDQAVSDLTPLLAIQPYQVDLDWRAFYETQASQVQQQVGSLPGNVIAVGHSNGGVIARQWSRTRDVGSIITLGSPNQGAPVVDHLFEWLGFLDNVLDRMARISAAFSVTNHDIWWWLPAQWGDRFATATDIWNTAGHGLLSLGFDYTLPVMPEMRVFSSYMQNLNSQATRDSEASRVRNRVALLNVAHDFDVGGPFRIVSQNNYIAWHNTIFITGIALDGLASIIRVTADVQDQAAFDLADEVSSLAEWFLQFEDLWCMTVSDPSPYPVARCYEHDGIVPAWSQTYDAPRLQFILRSDGPVHTGETADSDNQLYQALTTIAGVARRDPTLAPPPDPTDPPPSSDPPPSDPPPSDPPPPSGRYKLIDAQCVWDPYDSGPDQCTPLPPPGRYKFDSFGVCYWEPNDYPPDQCSPPAPPSGRYKLDGSGGCYWDSNDSGPDQCVP